MFLEFGVSVENIDEQTRSIRTEIEAVEKGNQQIKEGIKQEECTAHQLRKDSAHACSEMMELRTTSSDLLDSANMNEQTRRDLEKTLHAELVQPLKNKSSNTGGADQNQPQDVSDNNGATSATTTKDFLQQCHQRASTLFQSDNKDNNSNTLAKAKAEFAVIEQDIVAIEERIQKENLHEKLAQKKEEANARRQDLEAEMSRKEAVQKIMSQSRGRCGDYAQDIADKVRTSVRD